MAESIFLQISGVSKKFGHNQVLRSIDLSVRSGEIYALIGPNGSGKTTLINNIVGLLKPDNGKVLICGVDIDKEPEKAKAMFGFIPDNPTNYLNLTGIEFIRMTARLRMIPKNQADKKISELIRIFPIHDILQNRMETYSRGNMQKTAYLAALIGDPKLLIIDEPIVGLDPVSIKIFGDTLRHFVKKGNTVFLSTHTLPFAEKYADRIGIIHQGSLVYESTNLNNLENTYIKHTQ